MAATDAAPIRALILAGARAEGDALATQVGVPSKAFVRVGGKSMLGRVLGALENSRSIDQKTVVGLPDHDAGSEGAAWVGVDRVPGADGPAASVAGALAAVEEPFPVLVTTCDHALLTPEMVDVFLNETRHSGADLTVALARRDVIEMQYPDVSRTYLRFGDAAYSSCNLFCLRTAAAARVVAFWQSAEADRKRPWRIAWRFGLINAMRLLIGRPAVERAFAIISKRLKVKVQPVILPFADAAVDVDTPDDLALVERILLERGE